MLAGVLQQITQPEPESFWAAFVIAFIFFSCQGLFYFLKGEPAIGWGDVAIAPSCGLWLYLHELPSFLLSTGFIALCTGMIWRYRWNMQTFPLAPALLSGLGITFLIRCFLTGNGI
jgi:prepilin signal peptidase PulO-like enzyme (type II secretory pathway)